MFWAGLVIGLGVGACFGALIMAVCAIGNINSASTRADAPSNRKNR